MVDVKWYNNTVEAYALRNVARNRKAHISSTRIRILIKEERRLMTNIINKIFQVLMDIAFGMAICFGLKALVPVLTDNTIVVITLIATAAFAEFIEVKFKK